MSTPGKCVYSNVSRVRLPLSPPFTFFFLIVKFTSFILIFILTALFAFACCSVLSSLLMEFLQEHTPLPHNWVILVGVVFWLGMFWLIVLIPLKIRAIKNSNYPNDEFLEALFTPMGFLSAKTISDRSNTNAYLNFLMYHVLRLRAKKRETAMLFYRQGRNSTMTQIHDVLTKYHAYWTTDFEKKRLFLWQIGVIYYFGYYFVDPRYTFAMANIGNFRRENELFDLLAQWYELPEEEITVLFELVCRIYGYGGYYRDIDSDAESFQSYFGSHSSFGSDWFEDGSDSFSYINKPTRQEIRKACKLFKINADTDYAVAKKIYRNMMIKNHPDRAMSEGLGDEMVKKYTQKCQEIQSAWNIISYMYQSKKKKN